MAYSGPIQSRTNPAIFPGEERERLAAGFPLAPVRLAHNLSGHPLLSFDMLALAAERMDPAHVECRQSRNANGAPFAFADQPGSSPAETIRAIAGAGRWVMLRFAEQLPEYADLLDRLLAEIEPVTARFGPVLKPRAFIFVSSPGTLTPFHFDPEFNILFQISGEKRFATCPPDEPWLSAGQQAAFHQSGDNLLPWQPGFAAQAAIHALAPGDALYVPYKAPHWVEVGDQPSVSLSLTWSCRTTLELEAAWQWHGALRRLGMPSRPPPAFPGRAPGRALLRAVAGRLGQG